MSEHKEKVTIYDISNLAGVSIATVSRVINGASNVSPKTRERILSVMQKLGYTPNAFARGLGLDSMQTIGLLCADSSDAYLAKAVYHIEEALRSNGYNSLLCCTGYDPAEHAKALSFLLSRKVDAAVLIGSNYLETGAHANSYIRDAAETIPVMLLNCEYDYKNVYSVFCDDFNATKDAAEFLINKNCKKLLYLYNSKSYSGIRKLEGFKSALFENGMECSKDLLHFCSGNRDDIRGFAEEIRILWDKGIRFDGVVTSEDYLAAGALKFALKNGIRVPEDLKITGYNNSTLSLVTQPELSSVDNKLEAMSLRLVNTLLGVLSGQEMPAKTQYSGILIERGTT